jgi:hypothetical protein
MPVAMLGPVRRWLYNAVSGDEWQAWALFALGPILMLSALTTDGFFRWSNLGVGVALVILGVLQLRKLRRSA